ncbi:alpha-amylase family protein [Thermospira aquatica]|uniref:Alpha-amylase n=1 Tax=Thermospira aquatica TaxID=2828656 RepID=A0AAX3BFS6_9SPIR|nr:alpha-amylase family protein [Thermospira aquatica]URA11147.1 alpha-amylase [Thermospira aquatica]
MKRFFLLVVLILVGCGPSLTQADLPPDRNEMGYKPERRKIIIYQMMTRLFANTNTNRIFYGSMEENGVSRFNDITDTALKALKDFGVDYIWYTGVIAHATMEDFTRYGIPMDDPDVVKGRAGSPYAIRDYYDVSPLLAHNVPKRLDEFRALVERTHRNGLKVIIDFVPNHVARGYKSLAKPKWVKDLGETDKTNVTFDPNNNFYYLPGTEFQVPKGYDPAGSNVKIAGEDGKFKEIPAKVTGNDVFSASPSLGDWFETVKLNYGVDIKGGRKTYFTPTPNTWGKMRDILLYWASFGVDGFRCDMAEMVPVEFWGWAIPQVKEKYPHVIFIAEIYNPSAYKKYLTQGKFDYLYDKVGLYDSVKPFMKKKPKYDRKGFYYAWLKVKDFSDHMLAFLENHDEERIASKGFAADPWMGVPGMTVVASVYAGPVMIYFGQEVGEPAAGKEGFGGDDGRTTIFDFWGVPEHQKWVNGGKFDGGLLSEDQKKLRAFYQKLLLLVKSHPALAEGRMYDLSFANEAVQKNEKIIPQSEGFSDGILAFARYTDGKIVLVVANFEREARQFFLKLPESLWQAAKLPPSGTYLARDLLGNLPDITFDAAKTTNRFQLKAGVPIQIGPVSAAIYEIQTKQ